MNTEYQLSDQFYLLPTTAGAYFAVCSPDDEPIRRMLLALLRFRSSPRADIDSICRWLGVADQQKALELVHRAQTLTWIQGNDEPREVSALGVGDELHQLLPRLTSVGSGLIVDWNGLSLARCGMDDQTAEALSALSADLVQVQERHAPRLSQHMGLAVHGWAAVDAYGSSRIGAWPIYVGDERLMLVLLGEPRFNQPEFLALIWVLINRYG